MAAAVAVFGAEGALGRAVAERLAGHFPVKVLLTKQLDTLSAESRCTVNYISYDSPSSIDRALEGVSRVFVTTLTDFNAVDGYNEEVRRGEVIAEACARARGHVLRHVVLHSAPGVTQTLRLSARHLDAKCAIGEIMRRLGLPVTHLHLPCFYEDLLRPPFKPRKLDSDSFVFETAADRSIDWMSLGDVGDVVANLFHRTDEFLHSTLSLSAGKLSFDEICDVLTEELPVHFRSRTITADQMRGLGNPGARDLANMLEFFCHVDQGAEADLTRTLHPGVKSLHQWIQDNVDTLSLVFNCDKRLRIKHS